MPKVKSLSRIAEKYTTVTPQRADEYARGVQETEKDWAGNTAAANDSWKSGVTQAATQNRFAAGVKAAGTSKWKEKTLSKGPDRYRQGVSLAGDDYARGFAPYRDVLENLTLPARKETGNSANYERVRVVGEALHKKKVQMLGSGG